jgi:1-acyl-sn-glycerol-3-phosphate acyltransferase
VSGKQPPASSRRPKIIAANHGYATDAFHLPFILQERMHHMMQKSMFSNPLLGWLLKNAEQIKVDRENGKIAFKEACDLLNRGETIVIFPESKLMPTGEEHTHAKTGAVRMALETGAPIIPLGIYILPQNILNINLRWNGRLRTGKWQVGGKCHLQFGEAWKPNPDSLQPHPPDVHALTDELMDRIYTLVNEIPKEIKCASSSSLNPIRPW